MKREKVILYPIDYTILDENERCVVYINGRTSTGGELVIKCNDFRPCLHIGGRTIYYESLLRRTIAYRVARKKMQETRGYYTPVEIQFFKDKHLLPHEPLCVELLGDQVMSFSGSGQKQEIVARFCALDIETCTYMSNQKFSNAKFDPIKICCMSYHDPGGESTHVFLTTDTKNSQISPKGVPNFAKCAQTCADQAQNLSKEIQTMRPDIFLTYNGSGFDFGYIHDSDYNGVFKYSKIATIDCTYFTKIRKFGSIANYKFPGVINLDLFKFLQLFRKKYGLIGGKMKLDVVSAKLLHGEHKKDVSIDKMLADFAKMYETGDYSPIREYVDYCAQDTLLLHKIFVACKMDEFLLSLSKESLLPIRMIVEDPNVAILGRAIMKFGDRIDDDSFHSVLLAQFIGGHKRAIGRELSKKEGTALAKEFAFRKMFRGGNPYSAQTLEEIKAELHFY